MHSLRENPTWTETDEETIVRRFCPAPHLHRLEAAEQEVQKVRYSRGERTACRRGMQMLAAGLCVLCLAGSLRAVLRASAEQAYRFPLKTAAWRVSDGYGERTDPFTGQAAFHAGVDLACAEAINRQPVLPNSAITDLKHEHDCDRFHAAHDNTHWQDLIEHGKKLGIGQDTYELVTIR